MPAQSCRERSARIASVAVCPAAPTSHHQLGASRRVAALHTVRRERRATQARAPPDATPQGACAMGESIAHARASDDDNSCEGGTKEFAMKRRAHALCRAAAMVLTV